MRRLLRKKGSVLFLVLVVMSLLIIAASATYYIVNNQHGSVTVRYSSEQSYQTAVSVSNTVSKYIDGYLEAISKSGNELDSYKDTIVGKMLSMPIGGTKDITSEIDLTAEGMGKAEVTIKKAGSKLDGDNTVTTYEITTTAEVNGETVTVTQVKEIVTGPAEYFTRFLTSTGNRPEDVVFSSHSILSEAYFENEYTSLGGGLAFTHINHSVYSLGTIYDCGIRYTEGYSKEIVVAENYYVSSTGGGSLYADNIYVGGNLINGENGDYNKTKAIYADGVYVLGDLEIGSNGVTTLPDGTKKAPIYYVNGDCHIWCGTEGSKFYVNGDLYLHNTNNGQGQFFVKGNVIIADPYGMGWSLAERIEYAGDIIMSDGSAVDETSTQYHNKNFVYNSSMTDPFDETTLTDVSNYINSSTKKNKYQVWDAEQYFNTTFNPEGNLEPIRLDDTEDSHVRKMDEYNDNYVVKIDESCIITPAETWGAGGYHNIFIDTSVYDEDIYIYLRPKAGSDTFAFAPSDAQNINIYIMGKHSVIFILPENVNFEMTGQSFVGHIDVFSGLSQNNISASSIQDGTVGDGAFTGRAFTELSYLQNNGEPVENSLYVDPDTEATIFKSDAFGGYAHNNIFLVTKGTKNSIDFSAQSTFLGYVYAPNALMTAGGAADGLGFIGGLIVGSYAYQTNAALAFTTPYDYYNLYGLTKGTDIVKYLINFANSAGGDSGSMDAAILQGYGTVGYK